MKKDREKVGVTSLISLLKALSERLKDIFFPKVKFNEEEEAIVKIIYKLLRSPGTVKITPREGPYYIVNADLHCSLYVNYGEVKIVGTKDSLKTSVPQIVGEAMRDIINESVLQDANVVKDAMVSSFTSTLAKFEEKLK